MLDLLLGVIFTSSTIGVVLPARDIRLRVQVDAFRPNLKGLAAALTLAEREIANYRRAIAQGDFASLEPVFMGYRADPRSDETVSDRGNLLLPEEGNHVSMMVPGERHSRCANGSEWAGVLGWKGDPPL